MKEIYTSISDYKVYEYETIDDSVADKMIEDESKYIFKVNVPDCIEQFERGNGEGMWCIATREKDEFLVKDPTSNNERLIVKLLNKSVYYRDIKWGEYILVETRGECRPVAILDELEARFTKVSVKEKLDTFKRVMRQL